mmetsp:Transcript_2790/g.4050  ORF Transcript_2790/g.4050 Transcript_2790/m.4050 type:complete len:1082 (-) Transcript_2790:139-3384(-)|eukprot:CAMPEP_0167753504 /NCGR_PEP_ID=MMETSP0110_2-20121227/7751_1 /TAXON_ID=629695 /ORGANISM="Gymnochlora sp., Strain CCMP2014" /LENGTH=1081 /DNA_ID=CAMNT_0007639279 /DNA_START=88 /DNA_END=3333 /DNA_ORIENTATION=+
MQALMIAALSAKRVPCKTEPKEEELSVIDRNDNHTRFPKEFESKAIHSVTKEMAHHNDKEIIAGLQGEPWNRFYRVTVRDGVCFRSIPDITAIFADNRGVPFGTIVEARPFSQSDIELMKKSCGNGKSSGGWILHKDSGHWLPRRLFRTTVLEPFSPPQNTPMDRSSSKNSLLNAARGLLSCSTDQDEDGYVDGRNSIEDTTSSMHSSTSDLESLKNTYRGNAGASGHQFENNKNRRGGRVNIRRPKQPKTAYNFYQLEVRAKISSELKQSIDASSIHANTFVNQEKLNQEVMRIIGKRWKTLHPEERQRYQAMAETDSRRYQQQLESIETKSPPINPQHTTTSPQTKSSHAPLAVSRPVRRRRPPSYPGDTTPPPPRERYSRPDDIPLSDPGHRRKSMDINSPQLTSYSHNGSFDYGVDSSSGSRSLRPRSKRKAERYYEEEPSAIRQKKATVAMGSFPKIRKQLSPAQRGMNGNGDTASRKKNKGNSKGTGLLPCPKCNQSDRSIRNGWSRMQSSRAKERKGDAALAINGGRVQRFRCRRCNLDYRAVAPPGAPPPPAGSPTTFSITMSMASGGRRGKRFNFGAKKSSETAGKKRVRAATPSPKLQASHQTVDKGAKRYANARSRIGTSTRGSTRKTDVERKKSGKKIEKKVQGDIDKKDIILSKSPALHGVKSSEERKLEEKKANGTVAKKKGWGCPVCTLVVPMEKLQCPACGQKKPRRSRQATSPLCLATAVASQKEQWSAIHATSPKLISTDESPDQPKVKAGSNGFASGGGNKDLSKQRPSKANSKKKYSKNPEKKEKPFRLGPPAKKTSKKTHTLSLNSRPSRRRGTDPNYKPGTPVQVKWCSTWYNVYIEAPIAGRRGWYSAIVQNARMDFHFNKIRPASLRNFVEGSIAERERPPPIVTARDIYRERRNKKTKVTKVASGKSTKASKKPFISTSKKIDVPSTAPKLVTNKNTNKNSISTNTISNTSSKISTNDAKDIRNSENKNSDSKISNIETAQKPSQEDTAGKVNASPTVSQAEPSLQEIVSNRECDNIIQDNKSSLTEPAINIENDEKGVGAQSSSLLKSDMVVCDN